MLLLLPILYVAMLLLLGVVTSLIETPYGSDSFYVFLVGADVIMRLFLPIFTMGIATASFVLQVIAMSSGESRKKNAFMMVMSVFYVIVAIVYTVLSWNVPTV